MPGQPMSPVGVTPGAPINTAAPASPTFQPGPGGLPAQPGAQRVDPTFAGEPRSAFQMAMANLDQEHAAEQARYDQEEAQARAQVEAIRAQELEFENQELQARREDAIAARQARARARYEGRLSEDEVQADKERQERRQAAQGYAERENALEPRLPGGEIYSTEINYPRTTPRERPSNLGPTEREAAREMGYADVGEFLRGPRQGALGDFGPTGRGLVAPGSNLRHPRPGEHLEQDIASQQVTADIDRALGAAPGAEEPIQDPEAAAPTRAQLAAAEARRRTSGRRTPREPDPEDSGDSGDSGDSEGSADASPATNPDGTPEAQNLHPEARRREKAQRRAEERVAEQREIFRNRQRAHEAGAWSGKTRDIWRHREEERAAARAREEDRAAREREGRQAGARAFGVRRFVSGDSLSR